MVLARPVNRMPLGKTFIDAVTLACRRRGLRLTPIRARVVELMAEAEKPLGPYELLERFRLEKKRRGEKMGAVAPVTAYRALDFLHANGFVHKLESISAFVPCCQLPASHAAVPFLICSTCHSASELNDPRIAAGLNARALSLGFTPTSHVLEMHGRCALCEAQRASA